MLLPIPEIPFPPWPWPWDPWILRTPLESSRQLSEMVRERRGDELREILTGSLPEAHKLTMAMTLVSAELAAIVDDEEDDTDIQPFVIPILVGIIIGEAIALWIVS